MRLDVGAWVLEMLKCWMLDEIDEMMAEGLKASKLLGLISKFGKRV